MFFSAIVFAALRTVRPGTMTVRTWS
jgi:hypothetical protein